MHLPKLIATMSGSTRSTCESPEKLVAACQADLVLSIGGAMSHGLCVISHGRHSDRTTKPSMAVSFALAMVCFLAYIWALLNKGNKGIEIWRS